MQIIELFPILLWTTLKNPWGFMDLTLGATV